MSTICAYAVFKTSGIGTNGLTVTWDIDRITRSDGTRTALVTGGANSIAFGRRGKYGYVLTGADLITYDYVFTAITADTNVDQKEMDALWTLWSLSWSDLPTAAMSIAGSFGKYVVDYLADIFSRIGAPAGASIAADIAVVNAKTTNLPANPAAAGDQMDLVNVPNATAITAIQDGLSRPGTAQTITPPDDMALDSTVAKEATSENIYTRIGAPAGDSIAEDIANISDGISVSVSLAVSSTEAAKAATGQLSITAGYTFRQTIKSTIMDDLPSANKLWLAIKSGTNVLDEKSQVFIEKTDGMTVLRSTPYYIPGNGSLTIRGHAGAWEIDIVIEEVATAVFFGFGKQSLVAGLKYAKPNGDNLPAWNGSCVIFDGIVREISE